MNATFTATATTHNATPTPENILLVTDAARFRTKKTSSNAAAAANMPAMMRFSQYVWTDSGGRSKETRKTGTENDSSSHVLSRLIIGSLRLPGAAGQLIVENRGLHKRPALQPESLPVQTHAWPAFRRLTHYLLPVGLAKRGQRR